MEYALDEDAVVAFAEKVARTRRSCSAPRLPTRWYTTKTLPSAWPYRSGTSPFGAAATRTITGRGVVVAVASERTCLRGGRRDAIPDDSCAIAWV
jgi:hypothetical protein